jgi:hypothetical protein
MTLKTSVDPDENSEYGEKASACRTGCFHPMDESGRHSLPEEEGDETDGSVAGDPAQLLGRCERGFRRYMARYEAEGLEGLIDQRLEQISKRRVPVDEVLKLTESYRERHLGWNVRHFHGWYRPRPRGKSIATWTAPWPSFIDAQVGVSYYTPEGKPITEWQQAV